MITVEPHIKGLIFDNDGTLAHTMPMHYQAWLETVRAYGGDFPEDLFYQLAGVPSDTIVALLNEKFGYTLDPAQVSEAKETTFTEKYIHQVQPIEPVVAVVYDYHGKLPMAVATGGIPRVANQILEVIGLSNMFDTIVTSLDVVENPKPALDIYAEAARRMGVALEDCLIFEDSVPVLEKLHKAGLSYVDARPYTDAMS